MPSRGDISAGRAFVEVFLKDDMTRNLRRTLRNAGDSMKKTGRSMMAAGTAMFAPLAGAVAKFASAGDQLHKMSLRAGMSVEALSELKFAAEQSGASIEDLGAVIQKMNRRVGRVTAGAGSSVETKALEELGLSVEKLRSMNPEERFLAIADAMANYGDNAAAAGLAQRAFGTGVDKLLPLIFAGKDGIEALRKEARDLGITLSTEDAEAAAELTDQLNRMKQTVVSVAFEVGRTLAESFLGAGATIIDLGASVKEWVSNNKELVVSVAKIGVVMFASGAALYAFGTALGGVATAIKAVMIPLAAMIAHPIIAGMAALGLVIGGLVYHFSTAKSAARELSDEMERLLRVGDKQRDADQAKMTRLEQLAKKERLTIDEMSEASKISSELGKVYGDLGIELDGLSRKLNVAADAQGRLNSMQDATRLDALKKQYAALEEEFNEAAEGGGLSTLERKDAAMQRAFSVGGEDAANKRWSEAYVSEAKRIGAQLDEVATEIEAIEARAGARAAGVPEADISGGGTGGPGPGAAGVGEDAFKRREELERRAIERIAELRAQSIQNETQREIELVKLRYQKEIEEAKKAGADTTAIYQAQQMEMNEISRRTWEEQGEEQTRKAEAFSQLEKSLAADVEREKIEATMSGRKKELALLELQRKQERERVAEQGGKEKLLALVDEKFALLRQGVEKEDAKEGAKEGATPRIALTAMHSAAAAQIAGFQAAGPEQRTAKGVELTEKGVRALVGKVDEGTKLLQLFLAGWKVG